MQCTSFIQSAQRPETAPSSSPNGYTASVLGTSNSQCGDETNNDVTELSLLPDGFHPKASVKVIARAYRAPPR
ncbi:hypothetical protein FRC14_007546 [Serendipita sp. 396]|nr:hypothetical protein FRC14_007546 [Serendipita sp. 396]KAG8861328.1 hypothetical protein FRC20_011481 [Serendipita sp. 405]KAG9040824.1 hypothetical protein FS842_002826 [Serendipita sp. 407]